MEKRNKGKKIRQTDEGNTGAKGKGVEYIYNSKSNSNSRNKQKKKEDTLRRCKTGLIELSNGYDYISLLYTILVRFDTRI